MSTPNASLPITQRTTPRSQPGRGSHRRQQIYDILDQGLVCHAGFVVNGKPFVIPTAYGRSGDRLILHGSIASRMMRELGEGIEICITVTLLDGLVLARSQFHHSMNYRSVMLFGRARPLLDPAEKSRALTGFVEHVLAGRSADSRPASEQEIAATTVLELPIEEASAKVRSGPPKDKASDLQLGYWSGVLPLDLVFGTPQPAPDLDPEVPLPSYLPTAARR